MKIFLPFAITDIGGTATFAKKFSDAMREKGFPITSNPRENFDVLLILGDCPLWYPIKAKIFGRKVVQRLDGVYHPATPAGKLYPLYNLKMKIIHNILADAVIYQSQFSKDSCEKFLGETAAKQTAIIYNGVEVEKIPKKDSSLPNRKPIKLLTFAKFRRRDQIEPLIESAKLLDPKQYTFEIFGSYTGDLKYLFENLPSNIVFRGKKQHYDLLQILHQYDIFLFSDQSACPNSVLEAMAAGLPIVAFNRGSVPELIKPNYNGEVVPIKENTDPYKENYPFKKKHYSNFSNAIESLSNHIIDYSNNALADSRERFSHVNMIERYYEIL